MFNILVAAKMDEDHVEKLQEYRKQLDQGLRIFEDIPELVLGVVDLYFFDWSWATAFGLAMSAVMVVFFAPCPRRGNYFCVANSQSLSFCSFH